MTAKVLGCDHLPSLFPRFQNLMFPPYPECIIHMLYLCMFCLIMLITLICFKTCCLSIFPVIALLSSTMQLFELLCASLPPLDVTRGTKARRNTMETSDYLTNKTECNQIVRATNLSWIHARDGHTFLLMIKIAKFVTKRVMSCT